MDLTTVFTLVAGGVGGFFGLWIGGLLSYPNNPVFGAIVGALIGGGGLGYGVNYLSSQYLDSKKTSTIETPALQLTGDDRTRMQECLNTAPKGSVLTINRGADNKLACTFSIP